VRALRLMACLSGPMLGIGLNSCTVGPDYQSPELKDEPRRSALNAANVPSRTVEGAVDIVWWKSFRDLQLSSLVEKDLRRKTWTSKPRPNA
jgi:outer membrane protein TolC